MGLKRGPPYPYACRTGWLNRIFYAWTIAQCSWPLQSRFMAQGSFLVISSKPIVRQRGFVISEEQ